MSWHVLALKAGGAVILAATSDAVVGALATIIVGGMAAGTSLLIAWMQYRKNHARDAALEETIELRRLLGQLERDRALHLEQEIAELRREQEDGDGRKAQ